MISPFMEIYSQLIVTFKTFLIILEISLGRLPSHPYIPRLWILPGATGCFSDSISAEAELHSRMFSVLRRLCHSFGIVLISDFFLVFMFLFFRHTYHSHLFD